MWMKQKDEPIRVAQIMGKLWAGGVEMVVFNYYRAIDKSKIQFDFYYDADSTVEPPQNLIDMGARFYKIPPYQKLPQYIRELKKHLKENQYLIVHSQQYLYRSRIVHSKDKLNGEYPFFGFGKDGSFVAPSECTKDMRANYRYIPYLYCATRPYLSVVEVRPRLGARVSVARIRVNERLRLLDFSLQNYPKGMKSVKINLFHALSQLYSKPVTEDDDTLDYIPTQYIAEFVKRIGYDGIVFKSSLYNDENSVNVVIFNFDKCEAVGSVVYDVTRNDYTCEMEDPVSELRLNLQLQLTPNNN